jgi:hypothetical protein
MLALHAHAEQQWGAELAVGRAKAYLVGSPYATDFGFASVLQAPLQVRLAHCFHNMQVLLVKGMERLVRGLLPGTSRAFGGSNSGRVSSGHGQSAIEVSLTPSCKHVIGPVFRTPSHAGAWVPSLNDLRLQEAA